MSLLKTSTDDIPKAVLKARKFFNTGKTHKYEFRKEQLLKLKKIFQENEQEWHTSLSKDLKMNKLTLTLETQTTLKVINEALKDLKTWMAPEPKSVPLLVFPGSGEIQSDPLGVVLVIGPWNYPISSVVKPLVGAIAAGNTVLVKPSEISVYSSNAYVNLFKKYFPEDEGYMRIIAGGVEETTVLLKERFDHIFFTGSPPVGKIVMTAAAKHLTPVTLELGGKSPCIIDKTANLNVSLNRIVWGKTLNCGQTCIAPDYLLVQKDIEEKVCEKLKETIEKFFGKDIEKSEDWGKIINQNHTKRIARLLEGQKIYHGGKVDVEKCFIEPTIIRDVDPKSSLMQEEIFGPLIPVIKYDSIDDAIAFINEREKPLALYLFTSDSKVKNEVKKRTTSGGVCINDTLVHISAPELPFGGVGNSGMGSFNGKKTFDTFSHKKSILSKSTLLDSDMRYPPYNDSKIKTFKNLQSLELGWVKVGIPIVVVSLGLVLSYFKFWGK